jgi:phosphatidate cytidylyltransferase
MAAGTAASAGSAVGPAEMEDRQEAHATPVTHPRMGSELATRIASALVLGIAALGTAYLGGSIFALFWLAAGLGVLFEWLAMTRVEPRRFLLGALGFVLVALTALDLADLGLAPSAAAVALAVLVGLVLGRRPQDKTWAVLGFLYAMVISLAPPAVRDQPSGIGLAWLLWMFAVVWATDIAAYFTGRRLGGPKLWPRVSPKKTWSGFIGGLVAGTAAGIAVMAAAVRLGTEVPNLSVIALVSAISSAASQLGDLGESALKRKFDVKDSSHLIPGHGGVMDRVDGFWAVAALAGAWLLLTSLPSG